MDSLVTFQKMSALFLVLTWAPLSRADCKDIRLNQLCIIASRPHTSIRSAYSSSFFSDISAQPTSQSISGPLWQACTAFGCSLWKTGESLSRQALQVTVESSYAGWDLRNALLTGIQQALESDFRTSSQSFGRGGVMRYMTLPSHIRATAWRKVSTSNDLFDYMGYVQVNFHGQVESYPRLGSSCTRTGERSLDLDPSSLLSFGPDRPLFDPETGSLSRNETRNRELAASNSSRTEPNTGPGTSGLLISYCGIGNEFSIACVQFVDKARFYPSTCLPNATTIHRIQ